MAISKIENSSLASGVPGTANLPAGTVLQVVQSVYTSQGSTTSTTYVDTGLTASITPTSATSKIFVLVNLQAGETHSATGAGGGYKLLRGSTTVFDPNQYDVSGPYGFFLASTNTWMAQSFNYLDSPATTSSTTYKIQMRSYDGVNPIYINGAPSANPFGKSTITLMEIAA